MERPTFRLQVPRPASGKNRQQLVSWGKVCPSCGKREEYRIQPSRQAKQDRQTIRTAAIMARGLGTDAPPMFPSEDCTVLITHHAKRDIVDLEIYAIRDRPPGFTGRGSDLQNLLDVLLDALQDVVFSNDNQVRRIAMVRELD